MVRRAWALAQLSGVVDGEALQAQILAYYELFAAGAAHALGVPGSSPEWGAPLPLVPDPHRLLRHTRDTRWAVQYLTPWLIRKARGRSLGDGRAPKRPTLTPVRDTGPLTSTADPS